MPLRRAKVAGVPECLVIEVPGSDGLRLDCAHPSRDHGRNLPDGGDRQLRSGGLRPDEQVDAFRDNLSDNPANVVGVPDHAGAYFPKEAEELNLGLNQALERNALDPDIEATNVLRAAGVHKPD
ncbi:MAG TPA: hypothetical protein VNL94_09115 [Candidatus Binatia bacterium]|nr:hypothetical protein [Candidatus Binatia bacterium]